MRVLPRVRVGLRVRVMAGLELRLGLGLPEAQLPTPTLSERFHLEHKLHFRK